MKHTILCCALAALLFAGCTGNFPENTSEQTAESTADVSERTEEKTDTKAVSASGELFAMDTYMTFTCYGERAEEALEAAKTEILRLDALLSTGNDDSEVSLLNKNKSLILSADTAEIVKEALEIYRTTDGAFDITVYPLMKLWGFADGQYQVPAAEKIRDLLSFAGSDKIDLSEETGTVTLQENQEIDLGGIAKGYASDCLMRIFQEYELTGAVVSLGGNVECFGSKPDGSLWNCGIQDPENTGELAGILKMESGAAITSGGYERYFTDEETGTVYHHILDPATGYPAQSGLLSVTIVSDSGILADGLSTALYVFGLEDAVNYWQAYGEDFDFIIITEDREIYITENLDGAFETSYPLHVVEKES